MSNKSMNLLIEIELLNKYKKWVNEWPIKSILKSSI